MITFRGWLLAAALLAMPACDDATSPVADATSADLGPDASLLDLEAEDLGEADATLPDHALPDHALPDHFLDSSPDTSPAGCPSFGGPQPLGAHWNFFLGEASGLAASQKNPGYLWTHNDGGEGLLYALTTTSPPATVATYSLTGVTATDWESVAVGPGPAAGVSYIYVGDIGDNGNGRPSVMVHLVPEPTVTKGPNALSGVISLTLTYPGGAQNSETLMVHPTSGDIYIVAKTGGVSDVFLKQAPHVDGSSTLMTKVTTLTFGVAPLSGNGATTGGDISPKGTEVVIRTYDSAFVWPWLPGETMAQVLAKPPCPVVLAPNSHEEAICYDAQGTNLYTLAEGTLEPLRLYPRQ